MYFEAEVKKKKYKLEVNETKNDWQIQIQEEGKEPEFIAIPKTEYTRFDEAVSFLFDGRSYMMDVVPEKDGLYIYTQGSYRNVKIFNDEMLLHESLKKSGGMGDVAQITAGMPGKIVKIFVSAGETVKENQPVLIMEAMKMENEIRAPKETKVKEILVKAGASVDTGAVLVTFEN